MASRMFGQVAHLFQATTQDSHSTTTPVQPVKYLYHHNSVLEQHQSIQDVIPQTYIGNDSIDVTLMGCFGDKFNTIACVRNGVMSLLVMVTGILCIVKLCRLHLTSYPAKHQYIIFYCATMQCFLCAIRWLLGQYSQLDFLIEWLKLAQLLIVSHLYWVIATRVNRKEILTNRVLLPVYVVALVYFTIVVIMGCVYIQESWIECFQPYWVALSSAEVVLVQLFFIAGIFITKRLNEISTLDSVRCAQKRDLWLLVIFFEVSAICGFIYDVSLRILSEESSGCSGVFNHTQEIYTPIFGSFTLVKFMLPIWAMLFVFHPVIVTSESEELLPQNSDDSGGFASVFTPPSERHRYHQISYSGVDFSAAAPHHEIIPQRPATAATSAAANNTEVTKGGAPALIYQYSTSSSSGKHNRGRKKKNLSTISEENSNACSDVNATTKSNSRTSSFENNEDSHEDQIIDVPDDTPMC